MYCDACNRLHESVNDYDDPREAEECALNDDWQKLDGKLLCSQCKPKPMKVFIRFAGAVLDVTNKLNPMSLHPANHERVLAISHEGSQEIWWAGDMYEKWCTPDGFVILDPSTFIGWIHKPTLFTNQ